MAYTITIEQGIVRVDFHGVVDGLDIVHLTKDPEFLPAFRRYAKAIYNFSTADEVQITAEENRSFATLGSIEANFVENLHAVIVLSRPEGRPNAKIYQSGLASSSWHIDIVDTLDEAIQCLSASK
jgi:hypothetical protein